MSKVEPCAELSTDINIAFLTIMARPFSFSLGGFYHIYNRGVEKRTIFIDDRDYGRFIVLLYLCNGMDPVVIGRLLSEAKFFGDIAMMKRGAPLVDIGAYCLMPNHFHLLLHERKEGGISALMQKLSTAYTMYFNAKYRRSGALFGGRFKARFINKEAYLEYLFAYIHLNPIKLIDSTWKDDGIQDIERARNYLDTYRYSSYADLLGRERAEKVILNRDPFSEYFEKPADFSRFVDDWLTYKEHDEKAWEAIKPEDIGPPGELETKKNLPIVHKTKPIVVVQ